MGEHSGRAGSLSRMALRCRSVLASLGRGAIRSGPALLAVVLAGCAWSPRIERISGTPPLDRTLVAAVDIDEFAMGEFIARDGTHLRYRLLKPLSPQPGRRYPLVLQLHGSGGIGNDNQRQMEALAKAWALPEVRARHPAYVLVPQFPMRSANYDNAQTPRSAVASPALSAALELMDRIAQEEAVDPLRVYATGFSMGGSAAWLAPTLRPDYFAAIVPIGGIAPSNDRASALKDLPIRVLHGDADDENPIDADRRLVAHLHAIGARDVQLREYVGLAHSPPDDCLPGLAWRDWLFAQRRIPPR